MNEQKVNDLLQRYFDGATTRDEESLLQRYFTESDELPGSLKAYRPLFTFFAEERAVQPPMRNNRGRNVRIGLSVITGIAASIAILFLIGLPKTEPDSFVYFVNGQRIYDETAAIAMVENNLQLLAASMQKAHNSMAAFERLHEGSQALQQFDKISEAFRQVLEIGSMFDELRVGIN